MEAANRWETEAIRESRDRRRGRPAVSQQRRTPGPDEDWRTLREVSEETGIPINTLRKWCRRDSVVSYLESDGEQTLRMLEMGSVRSRARTLGRDLAETPASSKPQAASSKTEPVLSTQPEESYQLPAASHQPEREADSPERPADAVPTTDYRLPTTAGEAGDTDEVGTTMLVPVDAWNKMLNQLGNLHEAGQQLAEARERAGKAETEAKFLRERLAQMRQAPRSNTQVARQEQAGALPGT